MNFLYHIRCELLLCGLLIIVALMLTLKTIGLLINPRHGAELSASLQAWFQQHGLKALVLEWEALSQPDLDLVIAIGGDGTVLSALGHFSQCPVLAINYGNVGFLTAGNQEDLTFILERLLQHEYTISERSMLLCQYPGGSVHAINEIVIRGATRMISVDCSINGTPIRRIRGDGLVVGTPTGSTAYLLSAGSPIVMPEVRCMILTGLNEYNFTARHLVLQHDAHVHLKITPDTREHDIYLSADGKDKIPLQINDEILIQESPRRARLIFMDQNYFFNNLHSRLNW